MKTNIISLIIISLLTTVSSYAQIDVNKSKLEIDKIDNNIYLFVQQTNIANPTSVVYTSPKTSILIDPGFKQMQSIISDSINALNGGEIKFLMTTHFHIDHAQAIEDYYNNTTILLSDSQHKNAPEDIKNVISSKNEYHLKLGNEELQIHSLPNSSGHTGEDAVFYFKQANVLIVGDYLFQDMYPIIDVKGGGSIDGYFNNIDYLLSLANDYTKIIPGHTSFKKVENRYVSKKQYKSHIEKLKKSMSIISSKKSKGLKLEEIIEQGLPDEFKSFNEGIKYISQDKWIAFNYNNNTNNQKTSGYPQSVLFSENSNGNWDLYSVDLTNGKAIRRITKDTLKDFQSDYCNCKNKIVFDSYRNKNTRNIFTLNLKTNELIQLTELETRDGHPVWSPDCKHIAFQSSRKGNPDVYIMDSLGKNIEQLTFNNSFDGIPKWSPNGEFLAFNSNRTGSPNIFLLNNKTKEKIQITADEKYNFVQGWVSNNKLLIITDVSEKRQMQIVDIKDNTIKNLPTDFDVTYARYKNGNIVCTQKTKENIVQLYLMNIDGLKQKQLTNTKGEKRFPTFIE